MGSLHKTPRGEGLGLCVRASTFRNWKQVMKRGLEALWEGAVGEGTVLVLQGLVFGKFLSFSSLNLFLEHKGLD